MSINPFLNTIMQHCMEAGFILNGYFLLWFVVAVLLNLPCFFSFFLNKGFNSVIENSNFTKNSAEIGGGYSIVYVGSDLSLAGCVFVSNYASLLGKLLNY